MTITAMPEAKIIRYSPMSRKTCAISSVSRNIVEFSTIAGGRTRPSKISTRAMITLMARTVKNKGITLLATARNSYFKLFPNIYIPP